MFPRRAKKQVGAARYCAQIDAARRYGRHPRVSRRDPCTLRHRQSHTDRQRWQRAVGAIDRTARGAYTSFANGADAPVAQLDRAMAYGTNRTLQNHGKTVVFAFQGANQSA
jgi:hypothetical protein